MLIPQKAQYAVRAVFELSRRRGAGPVRIAEIAENQSIPVRFLEVILNQLKQAGFVDSKRGSAGGYILTREPSQLSVGEVLQFVQGPIVPVGCMDGASQGKCPFYDNCVFLPMWENLQQAISNVYDKTTFQDLLDRETDQAQEGAFSYSI